MKRCRVHSGPSRNNYRGGGSAHHKFKKILGVKARFHGLQEPVLEAIIRHKSPIAAVTGVVMFKGLVKVDKLISPATDTSNGRYIHYKFKQS